MKRGPEGPEFDHKDQRLLLQLVSSLDLKGYSHSPGRDAGRNALLKSIWEKITMIREFVVALYCTTEDILPCAADDKSIKYSELPGLNNATSGDNDIGKKKKRSCPWPLQF